MRRTPLLLAAAALVLGSLVFGCMPAPTPPETPTPRASPEYIVNDTSIGGAMYAWTSAIAMADTVAADRILDDQYIGQAADGSTRTKPAVLHAMSTGAFPRASGDAVEEQIQHIGDLGVVVSRVWWGKRESDIDHGGMYRMTDVFVHRANRWRLVSEQMALVQPTHIVPQDSIEVAKVVAYIIQIVRDYGRAHGTAYASNVSSAFPAQEPHRVDNEEVPPRLLSIIDLPRAVYFDTTSRPIAEPFAPEHLRIQMLSPDAAVVTFEIARPGIVDRRTLVLRRDHGQWYLAHVHASTVPETPGRRSSVFTISELTCDSIPPRPTDSASARVARRTAVIPPLRELQPGESGIAGYVVERVSGAPIPSSAVTLDRIAPGARRMPSQIIQTDSAGGFAAPVLPGRYAVWARNILHVPHVDTVTIRPGAVDTLRIRLQYHRCVVI